MKDNEVPFWACIILTNLEMNTGSVWWALIPFGVAAFLLYAEYKNGKV